MIGIVGTGLLGTGFATAALGRGERVRVWNRTVEKTTALAQRGAEVASTPAALAEGLRRIHVVLSDDAAVDAVLDAMTPAAGTVIYDHTTTSTQGAIARTERLRSRGVVYLHAPVFMGPANAAAATGLMLVSGDREVVAAAREVLAPMTGSLVDLGPRVDAAAAFKLMGNTLLMAFTAGFADMLVLAKATGIAPADVAGLLEHFNPGSSLQARFARMIAAPYDDPSWELAMARKDAGLVEAEVARGGGRLVMVPAVATRMDELIADGCGAMDWTVLGRDALR
jgi:3-hydroxyisobutyrate dehydrogenase